MSVSYSPPYSRHACESTMKPLHVVRATVLLFPPLPLVSTTLLRWEFDSSRPPCPLVPPAVRLQQQTSHSLSDAPKPATLRVGYNSPCGFLPPLSSPPPAKYNSLHGFLRTLPPPPFPPNNDCAQYLPLRWTHYVLLHNANLSQFEALKPNQLLQPNQFTSAKPVPIIAGRFTKRNTTSRFIK